MAHYWGACSLIDAQVGTLWFYLQAKSETRETLFVYTSLPSEKKSENELKVPLMATGPDLPSRLPITAPVNLAGLLLTVAEWIGIIREEAFEDVLFGHLIKNENLFLKDANQN